MCNPHIIKTYKRPEKSKRTGIYVEEKFDKKQLEDNVP
jgi:hypothetical protein